MAHLHDLGAKIFHSGIGASVLHSRLGVARSVHIGHERNFGNSQGIDNDVYMNVSTMAVPARMGTDKSLMSGEMLGTEFFSQFLCHVHSQTMIRHILRVEADNIVVTFHILPFLIFSVAEICPHTGNRKIFIAAVQRRNAIVLSGNEPAVFVQRCSHGELVVLKSQVGFGGGVISVFRADMFECCQERHLLSARLHI